MKPRLRSYDPFASSVARVVQPAANDAGTRAAPVAQSTDGGKSILETRYPAMTRAFGRGRTVLTANLQFSAIVFAALLGILLFGDHIGFTGWLGMAVIIASCIVGTVLVTRRPAPVLQSSIAPADK